MVRRSGVSEELCSKCSAPLLPDALFCHACGTRRNAGRCSCGAILPPDASFCPACGATTRPTRPPPATRSPQLELRPVTVLYVDVIGSTRLAERLGPEAFREVLVLFRADIEPIIEAHGGFVAQYAGDSILAFFGYPEAQTNSARAAVDAAIELVTFTGSRHGAHSTSPFEVRVGCHSGPVIVEPSPASSVASAPAEGLVIALASRIQMEAPPNAVVLTRQTHQLVEEFFECVSIGHRELRGIAAPVELFRVVGRRSERETHAAGGPRQRVPFVNRERELAALAAEWALCEAESGRAVVLTGEAGVGKSRLIAEFCRRIGPDVPCVVAHCDEGRQTTPFGVFASLLADDLETCSAGEAGGGQQLAARLAALHLAADIAEGLEPLLVPQGTASTFTNDPVSLMRRIRRSVIAYVGALLGPRGLLVVEDIHWCDASSRQVLLRLLAEGPRAGTMIILTGRPGETELDALLRGVSVFNIPPFDEAHARRIIAALDTAGDLGDDRIAALIHTCDGNPLYIEECTRALIAERSLDFGSIESIPDRLQGIIWYRLDRLGRLKWLAQVAALIGHRFDIAVLARVVARLAAGEDRPDDIEDDIAELERADVVVVASARPGGQLSFRHALVREAAYTSLPVSVRRQWHQIVANVSQQASREGIADIPVEAIARHWSAADRPDEAARAFLEAARGASRRFANVEAMSLFRAALTEIGRLEPEAERAGAEAAVRLAMNAPIIAHVGWASDELETNNQRVLALLSRQDKPAETFQSHRMLFNVALLRSDAANVEAHLAGMRAIADHVADGTMVLDRCEGARRMFVDGDTAGAEALLRRSIIAFDPSRHRVGASLYDLDGEVAVKSLCSWLQWFAGRPDAARTQAHETIALARTINHPFSLAYALCLGGSALLSAGEIAAASDVAAQARELARQYYMDYWMAYADVLTAGARIATAPAAAAADLDSAGKRYRTTGARLIMPWIHTLEAEARRRAGDDKRADALLAAATASPFRLFRPGAPPLS